MKKNDLLSDEIWAFQSHEPGSGHDRRRRLSAMHDTLLRR